MKRRAEKVTGYYWNCMLYSDCGSDGPVLSALILSGSAIIASALFWWMILPVVPALLYLTSAIIILLRSRSKAD